MINHSMIFDNFFEDPIRAKALINRAEVKDVKYEDGVVYPNIAMLPESVHREIIENLERVFGPIKEKISFARYSFADTNPPHWAHSDREIAQFLALIYLSEDKGQYGTSVVRHRELDFETHPTDDFRRQTLLGHANKRDEWEITFTCPSKFNRLFVLNADLIHASMGEYGKDRNDGRLVISVFFDLDRD